MTIDFRDIMSETRDTQTYLTASWLILHKQIGMLFHDIYGIGDKMNVITM